MQETIIGGDGAGGGDDGSQGRPVDLNLTAKIVALRGGVYMDFPKKGEGRIQVTREDLEDSKEKGMRVSAPPEKEGLRESNMGLTQLFPGKTKKKDRGRKDRETWGVVRDRSVRIKEAGLPLKKEDNRGGVRGHPGSLKQVRERETKALKKVGME